MFVPTNIRPTYVQTAGHFNVFVEIYSFIGVSLHLWGLSVPCFGRRRIPSAI